MGILDLLDNPSVLQQLLGPSSAHAGPSPMQPAPMQPQQPPPHLPPPQAFSGGGMSFAPNSAWDNGGALQYRPPNAPGQFPAMPAGPDFASRFRGEPPMPLPGEPDVPIPGKDQSRVAPSPWLAGGDQVAATGDFPPDSMFRHAKVQRDQSQDQQQLGPQQQQLAPEQAQLPPMMAANAGPPPSPAGSGLGGAFGLPPGYDQDVRQQRMAQMFGPGADRTNLIRSIVAGLGKGLTAVGNQRPGTNAGAAFAGGLGGSLEGVAGARDAQDKTARENWNDLFNQKSTAFKDQLAADHQAAQEMTPRAMGIGQYGETIYGIPDIKNRRMIPLDPKTGLPVRDEAAAPKPAGNFAVPEGFGSILTPDEAKLPGNARLTAGEVVSKTANPDVLKEMPPERASMIKAIAEGRQPMPSLSRANPYNRKLLEDLNRYDPSFDASTAGARTNLRKSYLGGGKASENIASFDMVMQHIGRFVDSAEKLGNSAFLPGVWNPVANKVAGETNPKFQEAAAAFHKDADAVATELMKATRGTGVGSAQEIRAWKQGLDINSSPVTLRSSAKEAIELLAGRIEAQGERWNAGMNADKDPLSWLSPKAQEAYRKLLNMDPKHPLDKQPGATQQTAPAAGRPANPSAAPSSKPARVRQNGHTYELQPDGNYKAVQ